MKISETYNSFVIRNTPTCCDIIVTHSQSLDEFVSPFKRLRVWWHSKSCLYCQRYFDQLLLLQKLLTDLTDREQEPDTPHSDFAARIKGRVHDRLNDA